MTGWGWTMIALGWVALSVPVAVITGRAHRLRDTDGPRNACSQAEQGHLNVDARAGCQPDGWEALARVDRRPLARALVPAQHRRE